MPEITFDEDRLLQLLADRMEPKLLGDQEFLKRLSRAAAEKLINSANSDIAAIREQQRTAAETRVKTHYETATSQHLETADQRIKKICDDQVVSAEKILKAMIRYAEGRTREALSTHVPSGDKLKKLVDHTVEVLISRSFGRSIKRMTTSLLEQPMKRLGLHLEESRDHINQVQLYATDRGQVFTLVHGHGPEDSARIRDLKFTQVFHAPAPAAAAWRKVAALSELETDFILTPSESSAEKYRIS